MVLPRASSTRDLWASGSSAILTGKSFMEFEMPLVLIPSTPANGMARPATSTPISTDSTTSTVTCEVTEPYVGPDAGLVGRRLGMEVILGRAWRTIPGSPFEPSRFGTYSPVIETVPNPKFCYVGGAGLEDRHHSFLWGFR